MSVLKAQGHRRGSRGPFPGQVAHLITFDPSGQDSRRKSLSQRTGNQAIGSPRNPHRQMLDRPVAD